MMPTTEPEKIYKTDYQKAQKQIQETWTYIKTTMAMYEVWGFNHLDTRM